MKEQLTIIIPVYNEKEAIGRTLDELLPFCARNNWRVVVVDDGSEDGTDQILAEYKNRCTILRHPYNCGYGAAIKTGIRNSETEYMALFDSDGQHRPEDLEKLWQEAPRYDMVVGQRSRGSQLDILRLPGKWILSKAANFIVGTKIPDINSGLRIFRKTFINKILHLMPQGFSFTSTCTVAALKMGFLLKFISIKTRKRIGTSTVRQFRHGFGVLILILRLVVLFSPLRIFFPMAGLLSVLGFVYAVYVIVSVRLTLANGALLMFLSAIIIFFFGLLVDQVSEMRREKYM